MTKYKRPLLEEFYEEMSKKDISPFSAIERLSLCMFYDFIARKISVLVKHNIQMKQMCEAMLKYGEHTWKPLADNEPRFMEKLRQMMVEIENLNKETK